MKLGRGTRLAGIFVLVGIVVAGIALFRTLRYGFSAKDAPTALEALAARTMRRLAVPSELRNRRNPIALTPGILAESRAHFADHCATCHGNDGKGQTAMGPNFYPKVPDMTLGGTQSQSDGELFATIENGIRLTGMPGWGNGTAESARGSWTLVHFIRHLPKIGADELAEMERLNPKPLAELQAALEEEQFLSGGSGPKEPAAASPRPQGHHH
jgi:mono/diheme cytochrome c family protein